MQAQLDFYYIDNTGTQPRSQFLTADVNCVCPHELDDDEKDSCSVDEGKNLNNFDHPDHKIFYDFEI